MGGAGHQAPDPRQHPRYLGYIYVPQPHVARLSPGMALTGYLPELGERALPGKIIKLSDEAEFTPKNVQTREERTRLVYGVKIEFRQSR